VAPFVDFGIDVEGLEPLWALGNYDASAPLVQFSDNPVGIECLVGDQRIELDAFDQRCNAHRVITLAGQQMKANQIAERVGERDNLGRPAALGLAYGLALSPPFAPWPWRWTLTMVASTMAYSMSGSSDNASKILLKTSAFTQSRYRV
jgi:hypothetical protein